MELLLGRTLLPLTTGDAYSKEMSRKVSLVLSMLIAVPVQASRRAPVIARTKAPSLAIGTSLTAPSLNMTQVPLLTVESLPELTPISDLHASVSPFALGAPIPESVSPVLTELPKAIKAAVSKKSSMRARVQEAPAPPVQSSLLSLFDSMGGENHADFHRPEIFSKNFDGMKHKLNGGVSAVALEASYQAAAKERGLSLPDSEGLEDGLDEIHGVGFLTVDLKDSTPMYREEGVTKGYRKTQAYLEFAAQTARKHGGAIVRHMGDGYLFLFPGAGVAFDAAVEIQSRIHSLQEALPGKKMSFHSGVHGGRVIVHRRGEGLDAYGQALEHAFEYLDHSKGGDIAIAEGLVRATALQSRMKGLPTKRKSDMRLVSPKPRPEEEYPDSLPGLQKELTHQVIVNRATMFASLKDWSSTYDDFGRLKSYASIRAYQDYLRRIVSDHGGEVIKTEGEGVMMSFASAADSLLAAAAIQREIDALKSATPLGDQMSIQIGVSYGRAMREDSLDGVDFFGNTVNAAARLMKQSLGGDIVISRRLAAEPGAAQILKAAAGVETEMSLKGFGAPINTFRVEPASIPTGDDYQELGARLAKGVRKTVDAIRRLRDRDSEN